MLIGGQPNGLAASAYTVLFGLFGDGLAERKSCCKRVNFRKNFGKIDSLHRCTAMIFDDVLTIIVYTYGMAFLSRYGADIAPRTTWKGGGVSTRCAARSQKDVPSGKKNQFTLIGEKMKTKNSRKRLLNKKLIA